MHDSEHHHLQESSPWSSGLRVICVATGIKQSYNRVIDQLLGRERGAEKRCNIYFRMSTLRLMSTGFVAGYPSVGLGSSVFIAELTPTPAVIFRYKPRRRAPASAEIFANFRQLPCFHARLLSEYQNQYSTTGVVVDPLDNIKPAHSPAARRWLT